VQATWQQGFRQGMLGLGLLIAWLAPGQAAWGGTSSGLMDISSDGKLLACTNRDSGTVTVIDLAEHRKRHEVSVGRFPEGVSFVGETHSLAVAVYADDRVRFVDGDSGEVTGQLEVFDEPYGVVSNAAGTKLYVTLDHPGRVLEIDVASRTIAREMQAGSFVRGLALAPAGDRVYATEYYTGNIVALDLATGEIADRWDGISNDNLARQIVLHPTRAKAYVPHIRSRITAVHGEGSIFPYVSVIDTAAASDPDAKRRRRIPMDAFVGALVTANPWECTLSPDGKQFYVVFAGTNDMFACDVLDDNYRELANREYMQVGQNPRAVRVSPDNQTVYVYNALDFNVVAYHAGSLRQIAKIDVTKFPKSEELLRGKILFYTALQPMASRRWISCSSCHPDGEPDGRTWHNPEGLRNTQALAGMAWTHPIHWSADRDEVQDFEHTIRGKLMQGRGLLVGQLSAELGSPNAKRSSDLDALAAYCNSHRHTLSPYANRGTATGGLSEAALRGKALFFSQETRCAECHSGPLYTDSAPRANLLRHDVGTGAEDPSEKMGPAYDTPTLLNVYRTAPYLHHGKALTLAEVLTKYNSHDRHGKTSHLSSGEIGDLVEFLKSLPYEDPEPLAAAAGLMKVEK
jgi:DNA-binding beta-propeller fold protein YncE